MFHTMSGYLSRKVTKGTKNAPYATKGACVSREKETVQTAYDYLHYLENCKNITH